MIEVDHKVAIVRRHSLTEDQASDAHPWAKPAPLKKRRPMGRAFVGYLDVKSQRTLRSRVASVINLRHDFIAKIQCFAGYPGLLGIDHETHECGRAGRFGI